MLWRGGGAVPVASAPAALLHLRLLPSAHLRLLPSAHLRLLPSCSFVALWVGDPDYKLLGSLWNYSKRASEGLASTRIALTPSPPIIQRLQSASTRPSLL